MRKLVLVAVAALVWAGPANAKELLGAQLCGASGCVTQREAGLLEGHGSPLGDGAVAAPARPGPWYRGSLLLGDHGKVFGRYAFYYVPDGRLVVEPGQGGQVTTWTHPQGRLAALLERMSGTLKPNATPNITSVAVNGRNAADPQSYLELYTIGETTTTYPTDLGTQIVLETAKRTPWSDGNDVTVYPSSNLLVRDGQIVSIPGAIADRAAQGASLDIGNRFPWLLTVVGVLAAFAVAAIVLWLRRRPRLAPSPVVQA
jgi:hypothetical protein